MDKSAETLFEYLKNVLYYPSKAVLDIDSLPPDFQKLGEGMQFLANCIAEERVFTKALANGDLSLDPPSANNILASSSKALQSSLRHLQWQTKQVAKGDYSQHVDFMGEFSQAFNTMIAQLAERTEGLIVEKKLVEKKNLNLQKNLDLMLSLTNYTHNMIFVFSIKKKQQIFLNQTAKWFSMANPSETTLLKEQLRFHTMDDEENSASWEMELNLTSGEDPIYYNVESFSTSWEDEPVIVHILIDDTKRKKQEQFVHNLAYLDSLTGLGNRRYALSLMEHWISEGTPFLLSFIDLDYLKYCNDTFGHENGDRYLIDTANLLLTTHSEVCRIGGDEFILLSTGTDAAIQDEQLSHLRELLSTETTAVPNYPRSFSFATTAVPASPTVPLNEYLKITDEKMQAYKMKNKKPLSDVIYRDDRL